MQKNNNIHDFDTVINSLYGAPGTPQREEFRREAYSYCVGQIIREARKHEGMTQTQLADIVGIDKSYISRIEKGSVEPSAGLFLHIINSLGMNIARTVV